MTIVEKCSSVAGLVVVLRPCSWRVRWAFFVFSTCRATWNCCCRETKHEGSQEPSQVSQERQRHQDAREQQDETPASPGCKTRREQTRTSDMRSAWSSALPAL